MVKEATSAYPVFAFLTLRFALATGALLLLGWRRLFSLGWRNVLAGILIGLFLFAGYAFQTVGLQSTSASKAGFITGLSVVLVPVFSTLFLRRSPSWGATFGVGLATLGLGLLSLERDLRVSFGDLMVLLCALSFALHILSVSIFSPKADSLALTLVQVATVSVVSFLVSIFSDWPLQAPSPQVWGAAAFTGILATALAFFLQTSMQRFTTPTHTALIFTAEPVFAALFGVWLAHDVLGVRHIIGGTLILAGMLASEIRWSERLAVRISRFLSPHYVGAALLFTLGLLAPEGWQEGLLWALGVGLWVIAGPLILLVRKLRRGGVSDWFLSDRKERVQPGIIFVTLVAPGGALAALYFFHGPQPLFVALWVAFILNIVNLSITFCWKISQHVSNVAASSALLVAFCGLWAVPTLLLIPLVAWARVRVGAHTVLQAVAGGITGLGVAYLTLNVLGVA